MPKVQQDIHVMNLFLCHSMREGRSILTAFLLSEILVLEKYLLEVLCIYK